MVCLHVFLTHMMYGDAWNAPHDRQSHYLSINSTVLWEMEMKEEKMPSRGGWHVEATEAVKVAMGVRMNKVGQINLV